MDQLSQIFLYFLTDFLIIWNDFNECGVDGCGPKRIWEVGISRWKVGDDNDVTYDDDVDDNDADAAAYALVSGGGIVTLGDDTREAGMAETRAQHPSLKTK